MEKEKKINENELNNVNGGTTGDNNMVTCPKCRNRFNGDTHSVSYGSGCNEKVYWKCPKCGHEW